MTDYTINFNLEKYQTGDAANLNDQYNASMDIIDGNLYKINTNANTAGAKATQALETAQNNTNALTALGAETTEKAKILKQIIDKTNNTFTSAESIGCIANDPTVDNSEFINAYFNTVDNCKSIIFANGTYYFKQQIVIYNPNIIAFLNKSTLEINADATIHNAVYIEGINGAYSQMKLINFRLNCANKADNGLVIERTRFSNIDAYITNANKIGFYIENGSGNRGTICVQGANDTYTETGMHIATTDDFWDMLCPINCVLGLELIGGGQTINVFHPWAYKSETPRTLIGLKNLGSPNIINNLINDGMTYMIQCVNDPSAYLHVNVYTGYIKVDNSAVIYVPADVTTSNIINIANNLTTTYPIDLIKYEGDSVNLNSALFSFNGLQIPDSRNELNPILSGKPMPNGYYKLTANDDNKQYFTADKFGHEFAGGVLKITSTTRNNDTGQLYHLTTPYYDAYTFVINTLTTSNVWFLSTHTQI